MKLNEIFNEEKKEWFQGRIQDENEGSQIFEKLKTPSANKGSQVFEKCLLQHTSAEIPKAIIFIWDFSQ